MSLDLSGSPITTIPKHAFVDIKACATLTSVTIPNSVTMIRLMAFSYCDGLTSVMFQGTIALLVSLNFPGDLRDKYLAGGIGTYTTANPGEEAVWTKQ